MQAHGTHRGKGTSRFHSKAQWRWAFATHQPWAREHAHHTPGGRKVRYDRLPVHTTHGGGARGARGATRTGVGYARRR